MCVGTTCFTTHKVDVAIVRVNVRDFRAKVTTKDDYIHLLSGQQCKFSANYCQDLTLGSGTSSGTDHVGVTRDLA